MASFFSKKKKKNFCEGSASRQHLTAKEKTHLSITGIIGGSELNSYTYNE